MQAKRRLPEDDKVTEAGIESFPASDPPAHNMPGRATDAAPAADRRRASSPSRAPKRGLGSVAIAIGAIALAVVVIWLLFR